MALTRASEAALTCSQFGFECVNWIKILDGSPSGLDERIETGSSQRRFVQNAEVDARLWVKAKLGARTCYRRRPLLVNPRCLDRLPCNKSQLRPVSSTGMVLLQGGRPISH
jgi:hypothetical protein